MTTPVTGTGVRRLFSLLVGVRLPTEPDVLAPELCCGRRGGSPPGEACLTRPPTLRSSQTPWRCALAPAPFHTVVLTVWGAVGGHADPLWACRSQEMEVPRGNQGCVIKDPLFPCDVSTCYYLRAPGVLAVTPLSRPHTWFLKPLSLPRMSRATLSLFDGVTGSQAHVLSIECTEEQLLCLRRGGERCVLDSRWPPAAPRGPPCREGPHTQVPRGRVNAVPWALLPQGSASCHTRTGLRE